MNVKIRRDEPYHFRLWPELQEKTMKVVGHGCRTEEWSSRLLVHIDVLLP